MTFGNVQQYQIDQAQKPTSTQLRILEYMANGLKPRQVSQVMGIKEHTTRTQLKLICKRLKSNTVEQAVAIAAKHGWVRVDDYPIR